MKDKSKHLLIIFVVAIVFVLIAAIILVIKNKKNSLSSGEAIQHPKQENNLEQKITVLPKINLSPTDKVNVLKITLTDSQEIWKNFTKVNYELMYNSNRGPRGLMGSLSPNLLSEELFLGSESSGHKVYDSGITNGQITLYYEDKNNNDINLGSHEFIVGGYKYLNKWQTESFTFETPKKTRDKFVLLVLNYAKIAKPDQPKYIISFQSNKPKLKGKITLQNISQTIHSLKLGQEEIKFRQNLRDKTLTLELNKKGKYLLF